MTAVQKSLFAIALIVGIVGGLFLVATVYFVVRYFVEIENPGRHELTLGAWIAILYAAGALLLTSTLGGILKSVLSRRVFRALCWPGLIVGGGVFLVYLASIGSWLLGNPNAS